MTYAYRLPRALNTTAIAVISSLYIIAMANVAVAVMKQPEPSFFVFCTDSCTDRD